MKDTSFNKDTWFGIVVVVLGLLYGGSIPFQVSSQSESMGVSALISGRTLPVIISILMVALGSILAFSSAKSKGQSAPTRSPADTLAEKKKLCRVFVYVAAVILYFIGIDLVSFIISTTVFLLFATRYSGCTSKVTIGLVSLLTPVTVYYLFSELMMMPMPDSYLVDFLNSRFEWNLTI